MTSAEHKALYGWALYKNLIVKDGVYKVRKVIKKRRCLKSLGLAVGTKESLVEKAYLAEMHQGVNDAKGWSKTEVPTFNEWWAVYRERYVDGVHTPRMYKLQGKRVPLLKDGKPRYQIDYAADAFAEMHGTKPLDAITPDLIEDWVRRMLKKQTYVKNGERRHYSQNTLVNYTVNLKTIFKRAVRKGKIPANPWDAVDITLEKSGRDRVVSFEDQAKIERAMPSNDRRYWFNFAIAMGGRVFELDALRPEQIDRDEPCIKNVLRKGGKVQDLPIVDPAALRVLDAQLAEYGQLWNTSQATYWRWLDHACKKAGVAHVSPHTLRHTFATRYIAAGGDYKTCADIMGHTTTDQVSRTYAHLRPKDLVARSRGISLGISAPAASRDDQAGGQVVDFVPRDRGRSGR